MPKLMMRDFQSKATAIINECILTREMYNAGVEVVDFAWLYDFLEKNGQKNCAWVPAWKEQVKKTSVIK